MTATPRFLRGTRLARLLSILSISCVLCVACVTRQVDVSIYADFESDIKLRGYTRSGKPLDRGYNHPVNISAQRVSHILAAIEVRVGERDKHTLYPIITGKTLLPVSTAVAKALNQADSSQMVVVKNIRKHRRFGVFTRKYLTSFIIFAESDYLNVKVSRIDWEVSRDPKAKIPEPRLGEEQMKFRTMPGEGMHSAGKQTVAAAWRDPVFATTSRTLGRNDSGARTRTVLMEEPIPAHELGRALPEDVIDHLSPETLRALADLEELRQQGGITEGDYSRRRDELLGP